MYEHILAEHRAGEFKTIDNWQFALSAVGLLSLLVLVYLFKHKAAPDSYVHSKYVVKTKLKMVVAIAIPITLVLLVFGVAYWFGGLLGLLLPTLALALILEHTRTSMRSQSLYALSAEQCPKLHDLVLEVSEKIGLKKKPEVFLCRGCQARTYGWHKPKVAMGIPLFDFLTVDEVKSVIAHELGHIRNGDYAVLSFFAVVLTSLRSMVSACKQAVLGSGNALFAILMAIAGGFIWLLKSFVEIISLLFMRQSEFMADLHASVFEVAGTPTNFKRSLAKTTLLGIAESEFEKRVLTERVLAAREGRFPIFKLLEKPHIHKFYQWLQQTNFCTSDEMIEKISAPKERSMRNWGSTHPLVGDRVRNLEILMSKYPTERKQPRANDVDKNARVLIQEAYDDAVKFLYGYEGPKDMPRPAHGFLLPERRLQVKVDAMTPLQIAEVERCMRTERRWRFLGDAEKLRDIIEEDEKTLKELEITSDQIADRLESLPGQAYTRWREDKIKLSEDVLVIAKKGVLLENRYSVIGIQDRSTLEQPCYFELVNVPEYFRGIGAGSGSVRRYGDFQYVISKGVLGGKLNFPEVMIHLIRDHHFFGGKRSPFRLDPKRIVRILELEPGRDYRPKKKQMAIWKEGGYLSSLSEKLPSFVEGAEKIELGQGVIVYVDGNQGIILSDRRIKLVEPPRIHGLEVELDKNEAQPGQTQIHKINIELIVG